MLVDGRSDDLTSVVEGYLVDADFTVETVAGEPQAQTIIRSSPEQFHEAVFVARLIDPIPQFEFIPGLTGPVELTLGDDFQSFNWPPLATEEIEAVAETYLETSTDENAATVTSGNTSSTFSMSSKIWNMPTLVEGVNGIPPEGVTCD